MILINHINDVNSPWLYSSEIVFSSYFRVTVFFKVSQFTSLSWKERDPLKHLLQHLLSTATKYSLTGVKREWHHPWTWNGVNEFLREQNTDQALLGDHDYNDESVTSWSPEPSAMGWQLPWKKEPLSSNPLGFLCPWLPLFTSEKREEQMEVASETPGTSSEWFSWGPPEAMTQRRGLH